ncbi:MAG: hypothetical protein IGS39_09090 [Calothrix sp. C42_A2020_038]|nr:hypothetical protein [Calothrix sp. C42_A2020_038]
MNTKRQKIITSFFSLSFCFVLIVGCAAPVITLAKITNAISTVITLIDVTEKTLNITSKLVNNSYQELGENIRSEDFRINGKFSNATVEQMESRHSELSKKHKELDNSIVQTKKAANNLFSMLETRANQNTRPELKAKLLNDINLKEKTFEDKIKVAADASSKVKTSIQEYDNILSVFQIGIGLAQAQEYITKVDSVIAEYKLLDQEVKIALDEGRQAIAKVADIPSQTPQQAIITNAPNENTVQQRTERPYLGAQIATLTPEKTIEEYYQLINQRQYANSWAILTRRFQRIKPDNNYNNYEEWWEKVASIKINSIQLIANSQNQAIVDAELEYLMKNGKIVKDVSRFTLIPNSDSKWLIDNKVNLER